MGEFVRNVARISIGYDYYVVAVANNYGTTAEQVLNECFRQLAFDLGPRAVISEIIDPSGADEVRSRFGLSTMREPVLLIMDKHPSNWERGDGCLRFELGALQNADDIKHILRFIASTIADEEDAMSRLTWMQRRDWLVSRARNLPVLAQLVPLIIAAA